MLYRLASSAALPGVGEAMATTSASFRIWKEAAWMSAWNWEPMMPTFTLPSAMQSPSSAAFAFVLTPLKRRPACGRQARPPNSKFRLRRLWRWVVAAYEFLQDAVAFVFQFIMDADLGGVVGANRQALQFDEEAHLR